MMYKERSLSILRSVQNTQCKARTMMNSLLLTLYPLTTTIVALPRNAIKWHMGFNLEFKGLKPGGT
jgi:hypothetical protein